MSTSLKVRLCIAIAFTAVAVFGVANAFLWEMVGLGGRVVWVVMLVLGLVQVAAIYWEHRQHAAEESDPS